MAKNPILLQKILFFSLKNSIYSSQKLTFILAKCCIFQQNNTDFFTPKIQIFPNFCWIFSTFQTQNSLKFLLFSPFLTLRNPQKFKISPFFCFLKPKIPKRFKFSPNFQKTFLFFNPKFPQKKSNIFFPFLTPQKFKFPSFFLGFFCLFFFAFFPLTPPKFRNFPQIPPFYIKFAQTLQSFGQLHGFDDLFADVRGTQALKSLLPKKLEKKFN